MNYFSEELDIEAGLKLSRLRIVLVGTSHPGNIGAAARAMKVMGFEDLVLVRPRWPDVLSREEAIERASGADDVLSKARVVDHLAEALEGIDHVCATVMTPRDFGPATHAPRQHFEWLRQRHPSPSAVALVFGSERHGMRNQDVCRCHAALSIPTDPTYGSLNLAAAVQLLTYEWRQALGGFAGAVPQPATAVADGQAVQGLVDHWAQVLVEIGFLNPEVPKKLVPRLHQMALKAQLQPEDVHVLRGVARAARATPSSRAPASPRRATRSRPRTKTRAWEASKRRPWSERDRARTRRARRSARARERARRGGAPRRSRPRRSARPPCPPPCLPAPARGPRSSVPGIPCPNRRVKKKPGQTFEPTWMPRARAPPWPTRLRCPARRTRAIELDRASRRCAVWD